MSTTTDVLATGSSPLDLAEDANAVLLRGRLAAAPAERMMPSGDTMVQFRLIVRRVCDAGRRDLRSPTVDTIDCVSWSPQSLGRWTDWRTGELISVFGCLRRRFWRAGASVASRYEVEVHTATCARVRPDSAGTAAENEDRPAVVDDRCAEGSTAMPSLVEESAMT